MLLLSILNETVALLLPESTNVLKYNFFALIKQEQQIKFPLKMFLFHNVFSRDLGRNFPLSLDIFTAILFLLLSPILHMSC